MSCETCKKTEFGPVPYIAHEAAMARNERSIKRIVIALIVAVALIFASNALWLWAWTSYDYSGEETVVTQDGEGLNIYGDRNITDSGTDNPN